jgi:hypothetical protein
MQLVEPPLVAASLELHPWVAAYLELPPRVAAYLEQLHHPSRTQQEGAKDREVHHEQGVKDRVQPRVKVAPALEPPPLRPVARVAGAAGLLWVACLAALAKEAKGAKENQEEAAPACSVLDNHPHP